MDGIIEARKPNRSPLSRVCCVIVMLALAGCGDSATDITNLPGSFSATVTGTVSATLSGVAVSTGSSATGGWGIVLPPGGAQSITLATPGNDRPPPGTYPIVVFAQGGPTTETVFIASIVAEPGVTSYTSTEGTLTIASSTDTRVSGSFNFEARRGTVGNPSVVNVTGTFDATNTPVAGT
jgi:hypothetical protein